MTNPIDAAIGLRLRRLRLERGLSLDELAPAIGGSSQRLDAFERGVERIGPADLAALASALDVPLAEIFNGIWSSDEQERSERMPSLH